MLVLSDANAGFALPHDLGRQNFLWGKYFTIVQVNELFVKTNFLTADQEFRNVVIEKIRTRPANVLRIATISTKQNSMKVLNERQEDTSTVVTAFFDLDILKYNFKRLFKLLLTKPPGEGVHGTKFAPLCHPLHQAIPVFSVPQADTKTTSTRRCTALPQSGLSKNCVDKKWPHGLGDWSRG